MASISGWKVIGLAACSLLSAGAGLLLVFKLVTPQAISALTTVELAGLLLLLALPAAVIWACRRSAAEANQHSAVHAQVRIDEADRCAPAPSRGQALSLRQAA
ncbi:MAG: hypothetical protein ACK4WH_11175 [Phycisphaerales bacterium]